MISKILNKIRAIIGKKYYINISNLNEKELLKGKKILIAGGSSGIGYAIAKRMIECGAEVIITGTNDQKLENASKTLNCNHINWDISDIYIIDSKIKEISKKFNGKLDVYINCAGIYKDIRYNDCSKEDWDKVLDTDLKGAYFSTNAIVNNFFDKEKNGNVILIASNRGVFGDDGPYGIAKAGLINYGKGLAKRILDKNIRVNIINPGMTASNINGIKDTDDLFQNGLKGQRVIAAQEIAEIALFLASDNSKCLTGQIINADNGESIL
jgi:3-oxoacyl-[acyl-carrier protein] reductase